MEMYKNMNSIFKTTYPFNFFFYTSKFNNEKKYIRDVEILYPNNDNIHIATLDEEYGLHFRLEEIPEYIEKKEVAEKFFNECLKNYIKSFNFNDSNYIAFSCYSKNNEIITTMKLTKNDIILHKEPSLTYDYYTFEELKKIYFNYMKCRNGVNAAHEKSNL